MAMTKGEVSLAIKSSPLQGVGKLTVPSTAPTGGWAGVGAEAGLMLTNVMISGY